MGQEEVPAKEMRKLRESGILKAQLRQYIKKNNVLECQVLLLRHVTQGSGMTGFRNIQVADDFHQCNFSGVVRANVSLEGV